MSRAELILYATPTGPLADALDEQFRRLAELAPTTAQTYPPHCTLTGFFHRDEADIPRIVTEVERALDDAGPMPAGAVDIVSLRRSDEWVGLELSSSWLIATTQRFVDRHRVDPGDDPLRTKDWLHLSIAYGTGDLAAAAAATDLDVALPVGWEVALWQRLAAGEWRRLATGDDGRHG